MEEPGQKLKRTREGLNLRYRDVEEASLQIAARRKNDEFIVALSRLADIENKGVVPSIYRLYTLCAIYRLDIVEVMEWYGVDVAAMPGDASQIEVGRTHPINFHSNGHGDVQVPLSLDPGIDLSKTTYLTRMIQRWGKLPLMLFNGLELKQHRYAFIGTEDWSMFPLIPPGSLLLIDETRKKVATGGWTNEFERPIYFIEHRGGYGCGWCALKDGQLVVQPHPASQCDPEMFAHPEEAEILGQVVGVAMHLDQAKRRRLRP